MSRIESIEVEAHDLPLTESFEFALGTQHSAKNVLVTVRTETGAVGYGEGTPISPITGETQAAALATARAMAELIESEPVEAYRSLHDRIDGAFVGMPAAKVAVETAVVDAYCRERELPLAELFGNSPSPVVTDVTIPIVSADVASERAAQAVDKGFSHLKIKTGSSVDDDVERILAIADAAPDAALKVDANQGWTPGEAVEFARRVGSHGVAIELLEQPVPRTDIRGLAHVRRKVDVPIAADETVFTPSDAISVIRNEAADIINVKLGKSGLLDAMAIVSIAQAADLELMIGCMLESAIGIHTSAHLVAGTGAFSYVDLDGNRLLAEDVIVDKGPTIDIDGPGHGVTPTNNL